jgi:phosphatidylinositol kinase/protein kinase (PI-3  family)
MGTFKNSVIHDYIRQMCPDEKSLRLAEKNFMHSLAGSVVATYVLGVADRHPSNVMLTHKGQFFHIDYGNILGKFK